MQQEVTIVHNKIQMKGVLRLPLQPKAVVLFAHGSGSSHLSPRNNFVAEQLLQGGLASLLIDLLSKEEDATYQNRFDIELLTERLALVIDWIKLEPQLKNLPIVLFGASTGAAAALSAAAFKHSDICAIVSRGGRPDLALAILEGVEAPTLFIVGGGDFGVIELNQEAFEHLHCEKSFKIIPGATHLFEEPGCLEQVAGLARDWFLQHLKPH